MSRRDSARFRTIVAFSLALMNWLAVASAENWPTWQHDNRRTGATEEQLAVEELNLAWTWRSSSPPQTAWAGPAKYDAYAFHRNLPAMRNYDPVFHMIAAGDCIWFGSSVDDSLHCLQASDGSEKWTFTTDGPIRLAPTWSRGRVYFGSDDGLARCVDAETGELVWQYAPIEPQQRILNNGRLISPQPCRTGVVVDDGVAWFAFSLFPWSDSYLCSVDASTAKPYLVKTLPGRTMEGSPALSSETLIFPQGRVSPRVFDRTTGDDLGDMAKSGGGSVVVVSLDDDVLHGPGTDSRKGGFRKSGGQSREMVAALGRGNALVVEGGKSWMLTDDSILASDLVSGKAAWEVSCDCPFAMIKAGDTLFVGGDNQVKAFSADTGAEQWSRPAEGRIFGLIAANGRLLASGDTGAITCYATGATLADELVDSQTVATAETESSTPSRSLERLGDDRLIGHWAMQPSSSNGNRILALQGPDLTLAAKGRFTRLGKHHALELDGSKETAMVSPNFQRVEHPKESFTAEAWVRLDQLQDWGGIIGIIQDNGDFERGWSLGYRKNRFSLAVHGKQGPGRLTYMTADQPFDLQRWYHVAGSYDGKTMRLFVDGEQLISSTEQSGEIRYPDQAWFEIGAYHDKDEYFRMGGALHEVRLYSHALSANEIRRHFEKAKDRIPKSPRPVPIASGPWLQFDDPQTATVRWTTTVAQPTHLEFSDANQIRKLGSESRRKEHSVTISQLDRNRVYQYRIGKRVNGQLRFTQEFECDHFFNYSPPSKARIVDGGSNAFGAFARQLLSQTDAQRGQVLLMGWSNPELLIELCRQSELRIVALDTDRSKTDTARTILRRAGVYGDQVTVFHVDRFDELPFPSNWANLVVFTGDDAIVEALRQTRPGGGVTLQLKKTTPDPFGVGDDVSSLKWTRTEKPPLPGAGEWSHLYGKPNNAAYGGELLSGVQRTDELRVQWVGRPGPRYQPDRSGRKPSPLSIDGRLFLQGLRRIICVDAFNGTILWSLEIPHLERFNMPRDCSNWCVDQNYLYATVKDECWRIDVTSGKVISRTCVSTTDSQPEMDWGFIASDKTQVYGSAVRAGTSWTSFWGGGDAGWYDARSGNVTFPICSDELFCCDRESMRRRWTYHKGVVLNPTITIAKNTVFFVESRSRKVIQGDDRRVADSDLWKHLFLVALDAQDGTTKWEKPLDEMNSQVVFYLAHASDQLTLVSSQDKSYRVTSLKDQDGSQRWTQTVGWAGGKGDHGKAMMRPAIVGDRIFLRPHVLSLTSGDILDAKMPDGHGCGTYACTAQSVFYRAKTVTMWSPESNTKSDWPRLRPDCWLSTIPACGMLLSPEGGGGCSCGSWMETSIGFIPIDPPPPPR